MATLAECEQVIQRGRAGRVDAWTCKYCGGNEHNEHYHEYKHPECRQARLKSYYEWYGLGERPGCRRLRCWQCGGLFYAETTRTRYCSHKCQLQAAIERKRKRTTCQNCGATMSATRRGDSLYCGAACRQSAYRRRVTNRACVNFTEGLNVTGDVLRISARTIGAQA